MHKTHTDMKKIDNDTILFQYKTDDIFNNVALKTSYKSRFVSDDGRVVDELTLMDDDKGAFNANLQKVMADIYERIIKLTSAVDDAYSISESMATLKVQNNSAYNTNVLSLVDASIYDCIETGSIKEWYSVCGKADYEQEYAAKYAAALSLLSSRMFQLKKKSVKNTLGNIE